MPETRLKSPSVSPWPPVNLMDELLSLAQAQGLSLQQCAQRYAIASLPAHRDGWLFHETLGFSVKK
jgi:CRISPR-associated endonuclease/helicase Cas3